MRRLDKVDKLKRSVAKRLKTEVLEATGTHDGSSRESRGCSERNATGNGLSSDEGRGQSDLLSRNFVRYLGCSNSLKKKE